MEAVRSLEGPLGRLEERVFRPLRHNSRGFYAFVGVLLVVIAWGAFAYSFQARYGLWMTGMRDRILWGLYIALFVFFIGASMAGTFVSAILRITKAGWRAPITRGAEMITVAALITAAFFILMDIGRPDRLHHILLFGRWESPLVWDVYGLSTYLAGSMIYLYLAMIPDLALCRDRFVEVALTPRRWLYGALAVGWAGTGEQKRLLGSAMVSMTIVMVPVAVMMHTVTSWIFAMTLRGSWDSSMFGIYFVGGAVYSGVGLIVIMMVIMRRVYGLEEFLTKKHFLYLGYMLAAFAMIMIFFNVSEIVTLGYKLEGDATFHLHQMARGAMAPVFWVYIWGGLIAPVLVMLFPFTRNMTGVVVASVLANIGMLLERYFIVVGGLRVPLNPYEPANYAPSWVEWSLMAAGVAVFLLIITLLLKIFPGVSVLEMSEEIATSGRHAEDTARVAAMDAAYE